jgi:chaperonin GroEL (HSP60 family)
LAGNPKVHCRLTFCYTRTDVSSWSGDVKKATKAKVAVFTNPIDITQTETKGTVLIKNADDMLNFTRGEEKHMEKVSISTFAHACRSLTPARSYSKSSPTRV